MDYETITVVSLKMLQQQANTLNNILALAYKHLPKELLASEMDFIEELRATIARATEGNA